MPDKTGEEVQRGLTEGIRISTDAAKTVKSVQKAAAQASTGNYVAAGAELLKSEDTRRIITVLILAAFFMSVVIFFVAPLTLYETIAHAAKTFADKWEQVKENFAVGYYSGTNGRFVSFFKALIGVISSPEVSEAISDTSAGEEDLTEEGDLQLLGKKEALRNTYMRKIKACQDKINAREKEVLQQIKDGKAAFSGGPTIYSIMAQRFESEEAHTYDGNDYVRVQYDGTEIMGSTKSITLRQAVELLSLYSTQINSSIGNIKLSGLLKWLGYNAGSTRTIVFPLGKTNDITSSIEAWTGTFMPQYLIDEGASSGKLDDYTAKYGCSVADFMIFVDCPDLYTIHASESEEMVTETRTFQEYVDYVYRDYEEADKPILNAAGEVIQMSGPYHWEYSDYYQRYLPVRNWDAPPANYTEKIYTFLVERERDVDVKIIHISYVVPVFVRTRSIDDLVDMTGMWSGWLPSEPPSIAASQRQTERGE